MVVIKALGLALGILLILGSLGMTIYLTFEYPLGVLFTRHPVRCILLGLVEVALFLSGISLILGLPSL